MSVKVRGLFNQIGIFIRLLTAVSVYTSKTIFQFYKMCEHKARINHGPKTIAQSFSLYNIQRMAQESLQRGGSSKVYC